MMERATFGGGCFWCVEAAFAELAGVQSVVSGYAGGETEDPTYREVCTGETGHAEVVTIEYDADEISYENLLEVFFTIHDPTQVNRQGPDIGSQYRSIICYHHNRQREAAERAVAAVDAELDDEVATEIVPLDTFYKAEEAHQDYFAKNPSDAYCRIHAQPKVEKVREAFAELTESQAAQ